MNKKCINCENIIISPFGNTKLCDTCKLRKCRICGKTFKIYAFHTRENRRGLYCSNECRSKSKIGVKHTEETKIKMKKHNPHLSGSKCCKWKGGRVLSPSGYIWIYNTTHPFRTSQKYVREHRLVVEKNIGRYLTKEEVVHHLNGIKDDNRIENLALCNNRTHHLFIKQLQNRIRELEKI